MLVFTQIDDQSNIEAYKKAINKNLENKFITKVIVYSDNDTLILLPKNPKLTKIDYSDNNGGFTYYQLFDVMRKTGQVSALIKPDVWFDNSISKLKTINDFIILNSYQDDIQSSVDAFVFQNKYLPKNNIPFMQNNSELDVINTLLINKITILNPSLEIKCHSILSRAKFVNIPPTKLDGTKINSPLDTASIEKARKQNEIELIRLKKEHKKLEEERNRLIEKEAELEKTIELNEKSISDLQSDKKAIYDEINELKKQLIDEKKALEVVKDVKNVEEKKPMVTVIMTSYNTASLLEKAIRSILDQSYKNLELIVIDDCSTDNSVDIIRKISKEDSRLRGYVNKVNVGTYWSKNFGIKQSRGEFITFQDSDDYSLETRIEKQLARFTEPRIKMTNCKFVRFNPDGTKHPEKSGFITKMLRKEVFTDKRGLGSFDKQRAGADSEFINRLSLCYPNGIAEVDEVLYMAEYRPTDGLTSQIGWDKRRPYLVGFKKCHVHMKLKKSYYLGFDEYITPLGVEKCGDKTINLANEI